MNSEDHPSEVNSALAAQEVCVAELEHQLAEARARLTDLSEHEATFREVHVHDYVDRAIPVLVRMFEKRLRGYRGQLRSGSGLAIRENSFGWSQFRVRRGANG